MVNNARYRGQSYGKNILHPPPPHHTVADPRNSPNDEHDLRKHAVVYLQCMMRRSAQGRVLRGETVGKYPYPTAWGVEGVDGAGTVHYSISVPPVIPDECTVDAADVLVSDRRLQPPFGFSPNLSKI